MGLGGGPSEWDEYEWVRLPDLTFPEDRAGRRRSSGRRGDGPAEPGDDPAGPLARALTGWLERHPLWQDGRSRRILLADLDNLRADPRHWRARMAAVVALARQADTVVLAGQVGAVARAQPHLEEFAGSAVAVPDGSDLADHELLRGVKRIRARNVQVLLVSNDRIFATLAERGPLLVLSPGRAALSTRLAEAATRVVDLAELEEDLDGALAVPAG
ncbi:MAG TPA: hypothetical protein VFP72_09695 [Kineosporiaceae bacterium]|nr:hypothetical protein [Kineosporiaceae bacterium]